MRKTIPMCVIALALVGATTAALAQDKPAPEVPRAEVPTKAPPAASPLAVRPPSVAEVARLREHLTRLVDTRAARLGGPKFADQDKRLGVLRAIVRTAATQGTIPVPEIIWQAKQLEDLWGGSSALFTLQLMQKLLDSRPGAEKIDEPRCQKACGAMMQAVGRDTVAGITSQGWPMDDASGVAILKAARQVEPMCVAHCRAMGMHNPTCVEQITRQDDLMKCWAPPKEEAKP